MTLSVQADLIAGQARSPAARKGTPHRLKAQEGSKIKGSATRKPSTKAGLKPLPLQPQSQAEYHASAALSDASPQFDLKRRELCSIAACISVSVPNRLSASVYARWTQIETWRSVTD